MITDYLVRPLNGYKIRNPQTMKHLSEAGERVKKSSYWLRRKKEGSIEIIDESENQTKKRGRR